MTLQNNFVIECSLTVQRRLFWIAHFLVFPTIAALIHLLLDVDHVVVVTVNRLAAVHARWRLLDERLFDFVLAAGIGDRQLILIGIRIFIVRLEVRRLIHHTNAIDDDLLLAVAAGNVLLGFITPIWIHCKRQKWQVSCCFPST